MRALKGPFQRLTTTSPANVRTWVDIIVLCAHLYNFRVGRIGLNQLKSVYQSRNVDTEPWLRELNLS